LYADCLEKKISAFCSQMNTELWRHFGVDISCNSAGHSAIILAKEGRIEENSQEKMLYGVDFVQEIKKKHPHHLCLTGPVTLG